MQKKSFSIRINLLLITATLILSALILSSCAYQSKTTLDWTYTTPDGDFKEGSLTREMDTSTIKE